MVAVVNFEREVKPTGRSRGRIGWFGRVVMQIEVVIDVVDPTPYPDGCKVLRSYTHWRDAKKSDVYVTRIFEKDGQHG